MKNVLNFFFVFHIVNLGTFRKKKINNDDDELSAVMNDNGEKKKNNTERRENKIANYRKNIHFQASEIFVEFI